MSPEAGTCVQIVGAAASDALRLSRLAAELFHQAYRDSMPVDLLESFIEEEFGESQQRAELRDPAITTLLVEMEGKLAGYAQLRLKPVPLPADADIPLELWRIYLDHSCQGRGIGRQLLARVFEIAREAGHESIWLGVWERNEKALAFYQGNGFSVVGSQSFPIGGELQNDLVMTGRCAALL